MSQEPFKQELINPVKVKKTSELIIRNYGGDVPDNLPPLAAFYSRFNQEIINRALILNAMLNIYFKAPTQVIHRWILKYNLESSLTPWESHILHTENSAINKADSTALYWYIEALWALLWVLNISDNLPVDAHVPDYMMSLCPDLKKHEGPEKFLNARARADREIYETLDLYYRMHWFTAYCKTENIDINPIGFDFVLERRRALTWVMHPGTSWQDVDLRFHYLAPKKDENTNHL